MYHAQNKKSFYTQQNPQMGVLLCTFGVPTGTRTLTRGSTNLCANHYTISTICKGEVILAFVILAKKCRNFQLRDLFIARLAHTTIHSFFTARLRNNEEKSSNNTYILKKHNHIIWICAPPKMKCERDDNCKDCK